MCRCALFHTWLHGTKSKQFIVVHHVYHVLYCCTSCIHAVTNLSSSRASWAFVLLVKWALEQKQTKDFAVRPIVQLYVWANYVRRTTSNARLTFHRAVCITECCLYPVSLLGKNLPFSNIRLEIITLANVHQMVDFFMGGQGNNNL